MAKVRSCPGKHHFFCNSLKRKRQHPTTFKRLEIAMHALSSGNQRTDVGKNIQKMGSLREISPLKCEIRQVRPVEDVLKSIEKS